MAAIKAQNRPRRISLRIFRSHRQRAVFDRDLNAMHNHSKGRNRDKRLPMAIEKVTCPTNVLLALFSASGCFQAETASDPRQPLPFRHSMNRRGTPKNVDYTFRKYGGLKFLEAAHIMDLMFLPAGARESTRPACLDAHTASSRRGGPGRGQARLRRRC